MTIDKVIQFPGWVHDAIFYQVFPDRFHNGDPENDPPEAALWTGLPGRDSFFGGDLAGVTQRLDYLCDLGINALYLTPIFAAPSNHKYDTDDYFRVDPHFGGDAALRQLVSALHGRGMHLVLDGVFNHTGDRFAPFQDLLGRGQASPYRDWFLPRSFPLRQEPEPNYKVCGGACHLPKLNDANPEVRRFIYGVAAYWLREAGIDGWRLDVPWETAHDFWQGFRQNVKETREDAYLVGELWGNPSPWLQGDQFDGAMNYPLRELLLRFFVQRAIDAGSFQRELDLLSQGVGGALHGMLNLLGSHDTARILTVADGDAGAVAQMFTFLFAYPGCPMIYYGDEIGLEGANDPGCRGVMDWEETRWNRALHGRVRVLARLRMAHPALRRGDYRVLVTHDRVHGFMRQCDGDLVAALFNAGFQTEEVRIVPPPGGRGGWTDMLSAEEFPIDRGAVAVQLGVRAARLLVPAGSPRCGSS